MYNIYMGLGENFDREVGPKPTRPTQEDIEERAQYLGVVKGYCGGGHYLKLVAEIRAVVDAVMNGTKVNNQGAIRAIYPGWTIKDFDELSQRLAAAEAAEAAKKAEAQKRD